MGAFRKEGDNMNEYKTYEAAQKDFSAFAGSYVVLKYGYETHSEHYGSRRRGRWYCHTGYSTSEHAKHVQYELFQVGKRGGLKRLHLVARTLPEGIPFVSSMKPDKATCCQYNYENNKYYIPDEVLNSVIDSIPETEWMNGPGPVTNYHCYW